MPSQRPNRPNIGDNAGIRDRPGIDRPGIDRPGVRPGSDNASRPGFDRPGDRRPGDRPGIDRPGDRRPGDRPVIGGIGNRNDIGGGIGNRTNIGDRGGIGNRNNIGNRTNFGDRTNIGNRIGDNIAIGNDVNIGINNGVIGNRPNWDRGNWNNPNWGWGGGGGWAGNWHNNCIDNHYGWYNGCWQGNWGSNWYQPLAWGAVGWGLGAVTSGWGYGTSYSNPYYVEPVAAATVPYDYSQPVVVNNYVTSDADAAGGTSDVAQDNTQTQALSVFDEGLAEFKAADYNAALTKFNAALKERPGDAVVHEVRALALFALGQYKPCAAALNSLLSSAPGMDWTTMSSLYGNADDYQTQLRKLEDYCGAHPTDASSAFVLAYHYLVLDAKDSAVNALRVVVKNQPNDATAKRMLDALAPPEPAEEPTPQPATDAPETDLVGSWRASAKNVTIDLAITDDAHFTWSAAQSGNPPVELKGELTATSDQIALQTEKQGDMNGSVKSLGPDKWQFNLTGAPPSDPGLTFERVKK